MASNRDIAVRRILHNEVRGVAGLQPCRDSLCIFGPPPGQYTNGGCRCLKNLNALSEAKVMIQRMARAMRVLASLADPAMIAYFEKEIENGR